MIDRISALIDRLSGAKSGRPSDEEELRLAVAALLVEAARMDDHFDDSERETIARLLRDRFDLGEEDVGRLIEHAEKRVADSTQLFPFTHVVVNRFTAEERVELIEMLWEVVYADGEVDDFEASLLRRVGGLIYVADKDSGAARLRVLSRRNRNRPSNG